MVVFPSCRSWQIGHQARLSHSESFGGPFSVPIIPAQSTSPSSCQADYSSQNVLLPRVANVQEITVSSFVPSTSASGSTNTESSDDSDLRPPPCVSKDLYPLSTMGSGACQPGQDPRFANGRLAAIDGTLHAGTDTNTASDIVMQDDAQCELQPSPPHVESRRTLRSCGRNSASTKTHPCASERAAVHDSNANPGADSVQISESTHAATNGKQHGDVILRQVDLPSRPKRQRTARIMELIKARKPEVVDDSHDEQLALRVESIIDQGAEHSDIDVDMTAEQEAAPGEDTKGSKRFTCTTCNSKWHCHSNLK